MRKQAVVKSDLLTLLFSRNFSSFFATQFLGAFNDNLFKTALSLLIAFHATQQAVEDESSILVNLAAILFILPFFLLSPKAGALADRLDKVTLIRRVKLIEIIIMCLGCVGYYLGNAWFLLAVLFLMGAQSTFFGPLKYSYLPSVLNREQLVSANALIQASTFIAIILGMMLAGLLFSYSGEHLLPVSLTTVFLAVAGYMFSRLMTGADLAHRQLRVEEEGFFALVRLSRGHKSVWQAIVGISWFWMVGATYITQLPNFVRFYVHANEQVFLLCLSLFALGIGLGAILCSVLKPTVLGRYSVLMGLLGLIAAGGVVSMYDSPPTAILRGLSEFGMGLDIMLVLGLLMLGVSGGLYIVPLYTVLQIQSPQQQRSRMVAMNNIMNALYMVLSAAVALALFAFGVSISSLFVMLACLNVVMIIYFLKQDRLFLLQVKQLYQH